MKQLQQVTEMMNMYEQDVPHIPMLPSKEVQLLRIELIQRELDELKKACEEDDLVEAADAIIDLEVVVFGTCLSFGLGAIHNPLFDEVHRTNMNKRVDGKLIKDDMGKVLKPEGWKAPDLRSIIENYKILHDKGVTPIQTDEGELYFKPE